MATGLGTFAAPALALGLSGLDDLPPARDAVLAEAAQASQTLYLDIVMDGQVVRPLVRFHRTGDRLLVEAEDLLAIGLQLPETVDPQGQVGLDQISGLQVAYDAALQRVVLVPGPGLRQTQRLGYARPGAVAVDRGQGLVLDWDAYGRSLEDSQTLSLASGMRWFGRFGSVQVNGVSRAGDGENGAYARLDTTWNYSDPRRMWTWSAGDVVSGGLAWTRPVRLGGVQWRRNFGVRPDLIVYPLPQFSADATVPSSVELFVNNVRQYKEQVDPGPFVLSEFPRVVGAGRALVVVTDALGRSTQTSVPLYVDYQRLAPGLTDFSLEAGVLRRGFGLDSSDYGHDPVTSASWRRGLRNDFTVELHGETGPGLRLGGAGLAWSPLARYGVVTANFARSGGDGSGHQLGAGYQWFGVRTGFDLYTQRASATFRDLGAIQGGSPPLRAQDRATMWWAIPRGSLSLTWLRYRDRAEVPSRTISVGASQNYGRIAVSVNAFDDDRAGRGVSLSLGMPLGEHYSTSFSADHGARGGTGAAASVRREAPYAGGWGWEAQARDSGDAQLGARWRGDVGEAWFGIDRVADRTGAFAQGSGSVVLMDGQAFGSRRISDSFAVVSTNGVAGVPILFENRPAGRSDDHGYLLLADLRGWQRNRVAIDPDALAANIQVPQIERLVTPADRSGVRVRFELESVRNATVVLHDAHGQPVTAGTRVERADDSEAIVGFDGELWLPRYVDGEDLRWTRAGVACAAIAPTLPAGESRTLLGPTTCRSEVTQ